MEQVEDPANEFAFQGLYDGTGIVLGEKGIASLLGNLQCAVVEQQAAIVQPSIAERGTNVGVVRPQLLQFQLDLLLRLAGWE